MFRLYFHSDDCGLNKETTIAIIDAGNAGRLQGTSLMTGGDNTLEAVRLLKESPLEISIHLNLLEGRPSAPANLIPDLTDKNGLFYLTLGGLYKKLLFGNTASFKEQVFTELCAQIDFFQSNFPDRPVRLDGHLHIHTLPPLGSVMQKIFTKYNISYIRIPYEHPFKLELPILNKFKAILRRNLLNNWSKKLVKLINIYNIETSDYFIGSSVSTEMNITHLLNALKSLPDGGEGIVEVMLHLSYEGSSSAKQCSVYASSKYQEAHFTRSRLEETKMVFSDEFGKLLKKYNN